MGEEENESSHTRKRAASTEAEEVHPSKRSRWKLVIPDDSSDFDKESVASEKVTEKVRRVKPCAER